MKYLRVKMPDGSKWDVPASLVAHNRAVYYSKTESIGSERSLRYSEEFDMCIYANDELIDWAENNMNWSDVGAGAVRVKEPDAPDYQEGWVIGEKEVIEK